MGNIIQKAVPSSSRAGSIRRMEAKNISLKQSFYKDFFLILLSTIIPTHRLYSRSCSYSVYTFITYSTFSVFIPICTLMDARKSLLFAGMNPAFYVPRKIPQVRLFFYAIFIQYLTMATKTEH